MIGKFFRKNVARESENEYKQGEIASIFSENLQFFQNIYKDCFDVVFHCFETLEKKQAALIYIQGLSNTQELNENVIKTLMSIPTLSEETYPIIPVSQIIKKKTYSECIESISSGLPILIIDGAPSALSLGLAKQENRSIEEPVGESVIRGPREGFNEVIAINTSLLRRKIRSPQLKMIQMKIGKYSQTTVVLTYIEGLATAPLIEEVKQRLDKIDIDGVLESSYIEEMIEDTPLSPFPQLLATERPDTVVANLLEGRIAILVDGTPFSLIAPVTLFSFLQSSEDYYERYIISTLIRWIRYPFFLVSLLLPSIYIALTTFHQEMIPTDLLISMASAREFVPFPTFFEALLMEVTFEALREAGVRLPKQIGSAVSIVGALVIGQAAVQAGIVSPAMVIVVSITGIASFMIPRYYLGFSIRLLRFPMMILAGTLGILGIILGLCGILIHLCKLRSFGVPYLSTLAPAHADEYKDTLVRAPFWKFNTRPRLTGKYNKFRQSRNQKPKPPKESL
ncbi:spore germination protein [Bacillus sp. FJAT-49736]|uniref:spore germination protein n=1 Tax=Bacillus sp. FJAT-49736 TaxID=2833582 RepID=UPI001BC8D88E|nr:spore germination protein [Bacillus sp. FJAT-49736]MBS4174319.1 spore germination protein [Bacillus sp. FJAT-49736]